MGKLTTAQRKQIPKGDFAVPSKAPGPGSYPIENASHARDALARSSGKPVAGAVKAAVKSKYPKMGKVAAGKVAAMFPTKKKAVMPMKKPNIMKITPPGYDADEDGE